MRGAAPIAAPRRLETKRRYALSIIFPIVKTNMKRDLASACAGIIAVCVITLALRPESAGHRGMLTKRDEPLRSSQEMKTPTASSYFQQLAMYFRKNAAILRPDPRTPGDALDADKYVIRNDI